MAAREHTLLSTEIVNRGLELNGPDAGSPAFSVRVRRRLPDFLQSVNLKFKERGDLDEVMGRYELRSCFIMAFVGVLVFTVSVYFMSSPKPIYLLDFACYKPLDELKVTRSEFIELARQSGKFDEDSLSFQQRILSSSGLGDETYLPRSIFAPGSSATMKEGRAEASTAMFAALDELFEKCRIRPKDVGILVVNCSLFNPTPSLSAMIVNHYKMRGNILSYNLGGMGCSAGIISLDLASDILQANPNNYAVVVSTEAINFTWYPGKNRSMLIPNCFFRMGCSAVLLSNRRRDFARAKYQLEHIVRTHKGSDDRSFRSVYQEEDDQRIKGLSISRDLLEVGGQALKANITTLGPLVLPFSEQLLFFATLIYRNLFGSKSAKSTPETATKPYIPDYKLAFDHFCIHAASKVVIEELKKNLELTDENMEASRAVLHRFGNTSSSSIWYELAYLEAKGRVRRGDKIWQLAFGSGFKCNSAVWRATKRVKRPGRNPWLDCLDRYPVRG